MQSNSQSSFVSPYENHSHLTQAQAVAWATNHTLTTDSFLRRHLPALLKKKFPNSVGDCYVKCEDLKIFILDVIEKCSKPFNPSELHCKKHHVPYPPTHPKFAGNIVEPLPFATPIVVEILDEDFVQLDTFTLQRIRNQVVSLHESVCIREYQDYTTANDLRKADIRKEVYNYSYNEARQFFKGLGRVDFPDPKPPERFITTIQKSGFLVAFYKFVQNLYQD